MYVRIDKSIGGFPVFCKASYVGSGLYEETSRQAVCTMGELNISVEGTPNPNAAKFVLNRRVLAEGSRSYFRSEEAEGDPLAERLFAINGVRAVFMVEDFITVTKSDDTGWPEIVDDVESAIRSELGD